MTNNDLVQELVQNGYLKTPRIIEAFRAIDRKEFVPEALQKMAYVNEPLPIGYNQTISQPLTVAFMLELLNPEPGEKIFDIGCGSGWTTALLAYIISRNMQGRGTASIENPFVIGMERIPELQRMAEENVQKFNFIEKGYALVLLGDATENLASHIVPTYGFDKIIASASAERIPVMWKRELRVGGKIVAPRKESIVELTKMSRDRFEEKEYSGFRFVPLVTDK